MVSFPFPVADIRGTRGLHPPLCLVCVQSRPVWPRSPSRRWVCRGNAPFPCLTPRSPLWGPYSRVFARSPPGWTGDYPLVGVSGSLSPTKCVAPSDGWCSGSRALEFLGGQGVTALGNLVLSRRDSLLLDVRSTILAYEVTRFGVLALPRLLAISLLLCSTLPWTSCA